MNNNILWLDITMNDAQRMNLIDSLADLFHITCHFLLRKGLRLSELMV